MLQVRTSNTLLRKIEMLQPGTQLSSVTNQLGQIMYEITDVDYMVSLGNIKDKSFCRDKKLYMFYAARLPCRALDVYTDTNNVVVYTTWHAL